MEKYIIRSIYGMFRNTAYLVSNKVGCLMLSESASEALKMSVLDAHAALNLLESNPSTRGQFKVDMVSGETETKAEYIQYVKAQLATLDRPEAVASYDTGFGITIVNAQLGSQCHALDVLGHAVLKIRPPNASGSEWDAAWSAGRRLINKFCSHKTSRKDLVK